MMLHSANIIRIEAVSNYSRVYFADDNTIVVAKVLHLFQDLLPESMFVRVHCSQIVNKQFIKAIKVDTKNECL